MLEEKDKLKIKVIIVLLILLFIPAKKIALKQEVNYNERYQIFSTKKRIRGDLRIVIDKKTFKMNVYYRTGIDKVYLEDVEKIAYLNFFIEKSIGNPDEIYYNDVVVYKDGKYYLLEDYRIEKNNINITEEEYLKYMDNIKNGKLEDTKRIKPFIEELLTPEEFYIKCKKYFVPYYLENYRKK